MATTRIIDRQKIKVASTFMGVTSIGAANKHEFGVRPGTEILRMVAHTITAFNCGGTGTATLTVTDGTTTFVNAVDVESTGSETVTGVPKYYPTGGTISCTITEVVDTAAATLGEVMISYEYIIRGNGDAGLEE